VLRVVLSCSRKAANRFGLATRRAQGSLFQQPGELVQERLQRWLAKIEPVSGSGFPARGANRCGFCGRERNGGGQTGHR
jgi:hypothetical protein